MMRLPRATVAVLLVIALTGCGRPGSGPKPVTLQENDNGRTVHVAVGTAVTVVLHSTYWRFSDLPDQAVLRSAGAPSVSAAAPGAECVPGGGCGTVTASYTAVGAGVGAISAGRTSCGEARGCPPDQASYKVTIVVGDGEGTVPGAPSSTASTATSTANGPPGSATVGGPAHTVTITEAENGRTITVVRGDHLIVRLSSTYWRFGPVDGQILLSDGPATVTASAPGVACVPGGGCGTATATFSARTPGRTIVTASRTSCGEARGCTGTEGTYEVTVIVT